MIDIRWVTVFGDVPGERAPDALGFWARVLDHRPGTPRGAQGEYLPLLPPDGDGYIWLQRTVDGAGGWHPDLHVPDVGAAVDAAAEAGAAIVGIHDGDLVTLRSPAGLAFCLVTEPAAGRSRPAPATRPDGRTLADQLCLDLPADRHDREVEFWRRLTGWAFTGDAGPEFSRLDGPAALPVRFLLQRLGPDDGDGARAHLDLAADDRAREVVRHEGLGARLQYVGRSWTTLRDPAGLVYCVTDRSPVAGSKSGAS